MPGCRHVAKGVWGRGGGGGCMGWSGGGDRRKAINLSIEDIETICSHQAEVFDFSMMDQ